jgi:fluoride ion exporter CrcB/FEX
MTYRKYIFELIGWSGAVFSLLAYSLNSLNLIISQSKEYLAMNVIGCFFLIIIYLLQKSLCQLRAEYYLAVYDHCSFD